MSPVLLIQMPNVLIVFSGVSSGVSLLCLWILIFYLFPLLLWHFSVCHMMETNCYKSTHDISDNYHLTDIDRGIYMKHHKLLSSIGGCEECHNTVLCSHSGVR